MNQLEYDGYIDSIWGIVLTLEKLHIIAFRELDYDLHPLVRKYLKLETDDMYV
jgi:hypothetical protein